MKVSCPIVVLLSLFGATMLLAPPAAAVSIVVSNTNDSGSGSLRQAILDSNASAGVADTINFNIPTSDPNFANGAFTIMPAAALPALTDPVTIDGYSQPGATPSTTEVGGGEGIRPVYPVASNAVLMIALSGTGVTAVDGLTLGTGSDGSTITGLAINQFGGSGLVINSTNNTVQGNFIGTAITGTTAQPNNTTVGQSGIYVSLAATGNHIGSAAVGAGNVISGNNAVGVRLLSSGNFVQGNLIGTDKTGTLALGNADEGILLIGSSTNTISNNLISGNGANAAATLVAGLRLTAASNNNVVKSNIIGTDVIGIRTSRFGYPYLTSTNLGNGAGIAIDASSNNLIGGFGGFPLDNTIAFNRGAGISVTGAGTGNTLTGNSLFGNAGLGIDLGHDGRTPNDAGDTDTGPDNLQNSPVLTSASSDGFVTGTLNGTPNTFFRIELFDVLANDPFGYTEGGILDASVNVMTDARGNAAFQVQTATRTIFGQNLRYFRTATATNLTTGDTSELSPIAPNNPPVNTVPATQIINQDAPLIFSAAHGNAITVSDLDADISPDPTVNSVEQVNLTATNGTFILGSTAGLVSNNSNSTGNTSASIQGSLTALNGALNNLTFIPNPGFIGQASLTLTSNDLGNTGSGGAMSATNTVLINVLASVRTLSINNVSVSEGDSGTTNATFTATLSEASLRPITVAYATADNTAVVHDNRSGALGDYEAASGTLTFDPGTTTRSLNVLVRGDTRNEADETFLVRLFNPTGANVRLNTDASVGTGTILNDDPLPGLTIGDVSLKEGDRGLTNATFTVTLAAPPGRLVTVAYRTAAGSAASGSDYIGVSGTLTFDPLLSTQTITVPVVGDTNVESDETFTVTLLNPVNGTITRGVATGTILNDDVAPPVPAPPITIAFQSPEHGAVLNSVPVICGTALGVTPIPVPGVPGAMLPAQVFVVLQRQSDRKFWNDMGWSSSPKPIEVPVKDNTFTVPAGALPAGDLLQDDVYTLGVAAYNQAAALSPVVTLSFTLDRHAPTVSIVVPAADAVVRALPYVQGRATDVAFGTGVRRVEVYLRRAGDGAYYDGTQFVAPGRPGYQPNGFPLPTALTGSFWVKRTGLPSAAQLAPGLYRLLAKAYDGAGHSDLKVVAFKVPAATATTRTAPGVALSTATAQAATASVTLRFNGALDVGSAGDAGHYSVTANGHAVSVESAGYNAMNHSVTLGLAVGSLHAGDRVTVSWSGLQDVGGAAVAGQAGTLTAR